MTTLTSSVSRLWLVLGALFLGVAMAQAEDLSAVKARIAERLPAIDAHKASGAIGENNRGFVEVRKGGGDAASVHGVTQTTSGDLFVYGFGGLLWKYTGVMLGGP